MPQDIVTVVPTFNPPVSLLERLVTLAVHGPVLVSDDASPCTSDRVLRDIALQPGVHVLRHAHNVGIARGLNDGLRLAQQEGAPWLLTVDQDTQLPDDYVPSITAAAEILRSDCTMIGVLGAEVIVDRSGPLPYPARISGNKMSTEEVIQTGSLWSVSALTAIGGFDESLGIDAVDAAACLRLRERGFDVCLAPGLELEHAIGAGRTMQLFGKKVMVTGHPPARRATMVRNRLRLFPDEFRQSPLHAIRTLRRVALNQTLGLVTEEDRIAKAKGTLRGLKRSAETDR